MLPKYVKLNVKTSIPGGNLFPDLLEYPELAKLNIDGI